MAIGVQQYLRHPEKRRRCLSEQAGKRIGVRFLHVKYVPLTCQFGGTGVIGQRFARHAWRVTDSGVHF
jgi:hypothetical protein